MHKFLLLAYCNSIKLKGGILVWVYSAEMTAEIMTAVGFGYLS